MIRASAGITLFNPKIERLKLNLESILPQVDAVFMVDNASDNVDDVEDLISNYRNIVLIKNSVNFGIAKALNQLCSAAEEKGYEWILLLDQDSIAEDRLIEKYSRYTSMDNVAVLTPCINDENEADIIKSRLEKPFEQVHRCYTSASFTNLTVWREVGGFDQAMFIDCVDFDYCTTVEEAGYIIIRDNEAVINHILGHATEVRAFMKIGRLFNIKKLKKPFYTYNHSPLRTYYYARNIKYYTYKHKDFIDRKTEFRVYIQWLVLKLFFEGQKWEKLKAIFKGRRDARIMIKEYKAGKKGKQNIISNTL